MRGCVGNNKCEKNTIKSAASKKNWGKLEKNKEIYRKYV